MPSENASDTSWLSGEALASAIDSMCVGMIVTNAASRVVWINRSAERMLGLDRDTACGERLGKLLTDPNMCEFWHRASESEGATLGAVSLHWPKPRELKANVSECVEGGVRVGRVLLFCDVTAERTLQVSLSQQATERLMSMAEGWNNGGDKPHDGLTPQEIRILRLVGEGLGNDEIAAQIHVATSTVRTHLKHVYAKLEISSRAEAIRYAMHHGLV